MKDKILTVTLNPCIDKTIELSDFKKGEVNRIENSRTDAGGKGINASRVLSECDIKSIALSIVGGKTGELLESLLRSENVQFDFLKTDGETRTNYKVYDSKSFETTDINESGININEDILNEFYQLLIKYLPSTSVLILAGSIPPGCKKTIYSDITTLAKEYEVKVIVDADGELLKYAIDSVPYAIKPNIHELETLIGRELNSEEDIISAISELSKKGISLICVSVGKDGAYFYKDGQVIKTKPLKVNVKSAVGCGDSMVASIAYSTVHSHSLETTAKIATAAGSLTASKDGTNTCKIDEAIDASKDIEFEMIKFLEL